jgi:hypothetical protein
MGLDFGLQRKRVDPGYEGMEWKPVWQSRNCQQVREIAFGVLGIPIDTEYHEVGIGAITEIVKELVKYINPQDIIVEAYTTDADIKLLDAVCGLTDVIHEVAFDNVWEDITPKYEYRFFNSY